MKSILLRMTLLAILAAGIWLSLAWPHLNRVETGRTPEYPDLQPREYAGGEAAVTKAVVAAIARLHWTTVGSGSGPGGAEVRAVARTPVLRLPADVTVRVRPGTRRLVVSVRSESHLGPWDFGRNARNCRALLAELDQQLK